MAVSPYASLVAKNTTGYPSYLTQPVAKKKNTDSIYAAPLTAPGSTANAAPIHQPVTTTVPGHVNRPVTPFQTFDYSTDPIMQQINAVGTKSREDAGAARLDARRAIAKQYGDPTVTEIGADYAQAAGENPDSATTRLNQQYATNAGNLDENLNAHNLFFGGARIKQQGDLSNQFRQAQADQYANEQAALGSTDSALASALATANQNDSTAAQEAAWRALAAALANPPPPAGTFAGTVGENTGFGGTPSSGLLSAGAGGGQFTYGDADRPSYIGPDGTQVSPLTNRSLGYTPEAIPDGLVQPPQFPTAPALPSDPYGQTDLSGSVSTPYTVKKKVVSPPPGALAQALAAGIKSRRF